MSRDSQAGLFMMEPRQMPCFSSRSDVRPLRSQVGGGQEVLLVSKPSGGHLSL